MSLAVQIDNERRYRDRRQPLGRHRAVSDTGGVVGHGEPGLVDLDPDETVQFVRAGYARIGSHADDETVAYYVHPGGECPANGVPASAQQVFVRVGTGIGDDAVLSPQDAGVSRADQSVVCPRDVEFDDSGAITVVLRTGHACPYGVGQVMLSVPTMAADSCRH